jgi:hypothetical protein
VRPRTLLDPAPRGRRGRDGPRARPGGTLLLLDHIRSSWPPIVALQWLLERVTILTAGEHFTRRQLPVVKAAGLDVVETERLKAGTIERIRALKPAG